MGICGTNFVISRTLLVMPGFSAKDRALATKLVSLFPENGKLGLPNLYASILLFNSETGELQAVSMLLCVR